MQNVHSKMTRLLVQLCLGLTLTTLQSFKSFHCIHIFPWCHVSPNAMEVDANALLRKKHLDREGELQ